ncbi:uncharacterized protein LOC124265426 isoform X3 [Haliotis rubra]|uniref:uncharacterized protein LOC124265426 isoform X3 n=1 Tax=Haliotis rubra TaxID=36100 RepID=UPI001EE5950B|nr:uncharacterized protein LOC124265426 isoform X3 [Haliotis rubra]
MVFRLCLCVVLLFACGYAKTSSDYCRVLVNYDIFKTSVDQFLASRDETCANKDMSSESKATCLTTTDKRVNDLENKVASLMPEPSVDCGSPTPLEGTDVVYSSTGLHAIANYRCKEGFVKIHPGQQTMSLCQKDGYWTMVNVTCVNISSCSTTPAGRVLYNGNRSTTITGKVCQRWDSQYPHTHTKTEDVKFWIPGFDTPQTVTGSANYCRDPDRIAFLWCYTTDRNSRWEKCDVPKCNI